MAVGFDTLRNATASIAIHRQIQAQIEAGEIFGQPLFVGLVEATRAKAALWRGINAAAGRVSTLPLDGLTAAQTNEGSLPAASTITPVNTTVTPVRYSILLQPTDDEVRRTPALALLGDVAGMNPSISQISPEDASIVALVSRLCMSGVNNTLLALIKAIASSLTTTAGTTGLAYTYAAHKAAIKARRAAGVRGRGLSLDVETSGWATVEADLVATGAAVQYSRIANSLVDRARDDNLFLDVYGATDFCVTTGMPTSGADTYGETLYPGCLSLELYAPEPQKNAEVVLSTPFYTLEVLGRTGGSVTSYELVFWAVLNIIQQAAGFRHIHKTAA